MAGAESETRRVTLPAATWRQIDALAEEERRTPAEVIGSSVEAYDTITVFDRAQAAAGGAERSSASEKVIVWLFHTVREKMKHLASELGISQSLVLNKGVDVYHSLYDIHQAGLNLYAGTERRGFFGLFGQRIRLQGKVSLKTFDERGRPPQTERRWWHRRS